MNANPGKIIVKSKKSKKNYKNTKKNTIKKDVAKLKKAVKQLNLENQDHIFDTNSGTSSVSIPLTGYFVTMNVPTQGDDYYMRTGNEIFMKNIAVRFQITRNTGTALSMPVRIAVIYDKQCNGTAPNLTELFEDDLIATISSRNFNNRKRFAWLYDKLYILDSDDPEQIVNFRFKLNKKTMFDASTGSIGDITSGSLLFCAFIDSTVPVGTNPTIRHYSRLLFSI